MLSGDEPKLRLIAITAFSQASCEILGLIILVTKKLKKNPKLYIWLPSTH